MAVSSDLLRAAIVRIAAIPQIKMAPEALVEDITLLAKVWPNEAEFSAAVASCCRALELVSKGRLTASPLTDDLSGWWSYHFQLSRAQGEKAILRVVYRLSENTVEVMGFGHRFKPADMYHRIILGKDIRM